LSYMYKTFLPAYVNSAKIILKNRLRFSRDDHLPKVDPAILTTLTGDYTVQINNNNNNNNNRQ